MTKIQKIWLWVSIVMLIIPEIFFSFIISFFTDLLHLSNFPSLYEYFIKPQFFIDNSIYLFVALSIECLGMLGLLICNIKFNHHRYKLVLTVITTLILVFLLFIVYLAYAISNISFP